MTHQINQRLKVQNLLALLHLSHRLLRQLFSNRLRPPFLQIKPRPPFLCFYSRCIFSAKIKGQHFLFEAGHKIGVVDMYGEKIEKMMMDKHIQPSRALLQCLVQLLQRLQGRPRQIGQNILVEGVIEVENFTLKTLLHGEGGTNSRMTSSRDLVREYLKRLCGEGC